MSDKLKHGPLETETKTIQSTKKYYSINFVNVFTALFETEPHTLQCYIGRK